MLRKYQDRFIEETKCERRKLEVYSDTNQVYRYREIKRAAVLSNDKLIAIDSSQDDIACKIIQGKQYEIYYPYLDDIKQEVIHKLKQHSHPTTYRDKIVLSPGEIIIYEKDDETLPDINEIMTYAENIRREIMQVDKNIEITDLQLSVMNKYICITNSFGMCRYICSPEATFEVEIQKNVGKDTILGSSYLYRRSLKDIQLETILKDISFPLSHQTYHGIDYSKTSTVVFGHPIMASMLENICYYNLNNRKDLDEKMKISIVNEPLLEQSVNYYPFDDNGEINRRSTLYGKDFLERDNSFSSRYKIGPRNIHRSISAPLLPHKENIVLSGKRYDIEDLYSDIQSGIYCHLIVGNHYCRGDYIEGTVFNGFEIQNGKFTKALQPFKIKLNKRELLLNINMLGNDERFERPFPWWKPMIAYTPTVVANSLKLE